MGNSNGTQWSSIVFEDEEDEESWFEWMEEPDTENPSWFLPVSPNTHVSAIQPLRQASHDVKAPQSEQLSVHYYSNNNKIQGLSQNDTSVLNNEEPSVDDRIRDGQASPTDVKPPQTLTGNFIDDVTEAPSKQFPTGEVNISLTYDPVSGGPSRVKVQIVKARNLSCKAREGKDRCGVSCFESYIQVSLLCCHTVIKSHCTPTKKGCSDVLFYETWAFDFPNISLKELALEVTAMHRCKHVLKRDHVIGRAVTAPSATDRTLRRHWWTALAHPGQTINRWQTLWN